MGNEYSALSPSIRRTSGFSHEELSRLEKRFRKLDIDCDGSVRYINIKCKANMLLKTYFGILFELT